MGENRGQRQYRDFVLFAVGILVVFLTIYGVLFITPRIGAADNGDFYRLAGRLGISSEKIQAPEDPWPYFDRVYEQFEYYPLEPELLTPNKQSFSNLWPSLLVRGLTNLFSDTAVTPFSTTYLAVVYSLMLLAACGLLIRVAIKWFGGKYLILLPVFVILFLGSMHLAWMNSFYGEAMSYVSLLLLLGDYLYIFSCGEEWPKKKKAAMLILSAVSSYLFLTAKAQNVLAYPLWAGMLILTVCFLFPGWKEKPRQAWPAYIFCALWCVWMGVCCVRLYQWNSEINEKDTLYNSIQYGVLCLADSQEEEETILKEMGLDPQLAQDTGKHAYWGNKEELFLVPRTEKAQEMLYDKISTLGVLKFYLLHPRYLYRAMEITANEASLPYTMLFHFAGDASGNAHAAGRLALWQNIRGYVVPDHFLQYVIVYAVAIAVCISALIRFRKNKRRCLCILLGLAVILTGIIQFPLPFIGNGFADPRKQLYLFSLCYDMLIFSVLAWGLHWFFEKRSLSVKDWFGRETP